MQKNFGKYFEYLIHLGKLSRILFLISDHQDSELRLYLLSG